MRTEVSAVFTARCWGVGSQLEKRGVKIGGLAPVMGTVIRTTFSLLLLLAVSFLFLALCFLLPLPLHAEGIIGLSHGQTIYVPAYSHIYSGDRERPFLLTVTLSIRNIDPNNLIKVTTVDYYETQGNLLKKFLSKPVVLKPLESIRYVIPERHKAGGSGANFIVEWKSDKSVNPPIVESVMIGTQSQQGISFTSRGKAIITSE
jgi:hypothetical protein